MKTFSLYALTAAVCLQSSFASPLSTRDNTTAQYSFANLTASPELVWKPCYQNFTCALLQVPLDYTNASVGTVNIAVIKKPGETSDAQEVLVNPGGPGGSSVDMILGDYEAIQEKIGTKYALVGIDPRGIKNSGPSSNCFPGYSHVARNAFFADVFGPADISHDYQLKKNHQSVLAYGKWCSQIYSVNGTARYASTVATAQDMLHYIQLRAKDNGRKPEDAKLWFYGISYGSILGPTFAALYPDRVERMIIDGILELEDHYNGGWEKALADSDEAARFWFKRCFEAGPQICAFHQNATSWQELEKRYWNMLHVLKDNPIGLGDPLSPTSIEYAKAGTIVTPNVFTWRAVVTQFFTASYIIAPFYYAALDQTLLELQVGQYNQTQAISLESQISSFRPTDDDRMARALVTCLDSNGRSNYTKFEDYKKFIYSMTNTSIYAGLNVATFSGPVCSQLNVRPPKSQSFDGIPKLNGKKVPILWVSSIADPVTPLPSARKMQSQFPGSELLVFNNSGHCAHFQKAACVSKYEKQYMFDGTLPPANTTCEVDEPNPFLAVAKQLADAAQG
ncbi:alpha/beta-hydrolase [Ophiobolus disseminans]|uniref:Alpha/beta-hydrolase n=1 Tax=Ophiobolus disseminans TaxID=1469910 RepID=A0A6A6ZBK7_9PLEO|nr:alpha/beta-hydrolase [Ophiobolus disseminans]